MIFRQNSNLIHKLICVCNGTHDIFSEVGTEFRSIAEMNFGPQWFKRRKPYAYFMNVNKSKNNPYDLLLERGVHAFFAVYPVSLHMMCTYSHSTCTGVYRIQRKLLSEQRLTSAKIRMNKKNKCSVWSPGFNDVTVKRNTV
jgi:hypothetical protein